MHRQDVISALLDAIDDDTLVVSNIADASFELCMLGDRARNFYMLGSFGLASSIALGLALSRPERVVAVDGDGALLYNLGTLPTLGRYRPANLLHIVVDNGRHGATGLQRTATSKGAALDAIAAGCGLPVTAITKHGELEPTIRSLLRATGPQFLLVRVNEEPPERAPLPPYSGVEIRARFMQALAG